MKRRRRTRNTARGGGLPRRRTRGHPVQAGLSLVVWLLIAAAVLLAAASCMHV